MALFTESELRYLASERRLARLATVGANGTPHVVPVGMWSYNESLGTIDVAGRDLGAVEEGPRRGPQRPGRARRR